MKINYFACLIALFFAHYAGAHTASDSYLTIQDKDEHLSVQWDIALRDLDFALGLDINRDRQLTGAEIKTKADTITQYAFINPSNKSVALLPLVITPLYLLIPILNHQKTHYRWWDILL